MKLTKEVKDLIKKEYNEFKDKMYAGKTKEERDELAQFFTPPEISIKLIEELTDLTGNVLDPTSGSGNLLAAALIAGADSDKVFGNDYDITMVNLCRDRLNQVCDMLGKPHIQDWQIHQGNALHEFALTEFGPDYEEYYFDGVSTDTAKAKRLNNVDETVIKYNIGNGIVKERDYQIYYCNRKFQAAHFDSCIAWNERHKKIVEEAVAADNGYDEKIK